MEFSILLAAAMFAAYLVKGLCGFANTLVLTSVLAFRVSNAAITPLDLVVGVPANAWQAWKNRRNICWGQAAVLALLVIAGTIPGALVLKSGDVRLIKLAFGALVTALGLQMLCTAGRPQKPPSRLAVLATGAVAGLVVGMFGVGAMLAACVSRTAKDMHAFRGTLAAVFFTENLFRLVLYSVTGLLTRATLTLALCCAPFMAAGLVTGTVLAGYIPEAAAKRLVHLFLILSGLSLVVTNLLALV